MLAAVCCSALAWCSVRELRSLLPWAISELALDRPSPHVGHHAGQVGLHERERGHELAHFILAVLRNGGGEVPLGHPLGQVRCLRQGGGDRAGQHPREQHSERDAQHAQGHQQLPAGLAVLLDGPAQRIYLIALVAQQLVHLGGVVVRLGHELLLEQGIGLVHLALFLEREDHVAVLEVDRAQRADFRKDSLLGVEEHQRLDSFLQLARALGRGLALLCKEVRQRRVAAARDGGGARDAGAQVARPVAHQALGLDGVLQHLPRGVSHGVQARDAQRDGADQQQQHQRKPKRKALGDREIGESAHRGGCPDV
jgi:hypothetical protein